MGKKEQQLLETLGDFTSKENWDKFFTIRGSDDTFEWYAEWPQLREPLLSFLSTTTTTTTLAAAETSSSVTPPPLQILIPGCGNSRLSEHLYDAGFRCITNIDFSKVVISEMLRRNVRLRPDMKWRIMDMTDMQFVDETFDAVLDKGGLDALMEPELGPKLGNQYISEVKRVLQKGGKFICLTLGESHVLGALFPKFRYGWRLSVHALPQKPSNKPGLQTFMVIAEKESSSMLHAIYLSFDPISLPSKGDQVRGLSQALDTENKIRAEFANGSDILYTLEDLQLGAKGDLAQLRPGHRVQLTMGEEGHSLFVYKAVLLDSPQHSESDLFLYDCGVFLVPKTRAHEWLFSSEEGQWMVVESSKSARLIMVFLDSSHAEASMDEIQKDLSPLVKQLEPWKNSSGAQIPFMAASDGIKERKLVHQVTSALTGPVIVDEVVYEKVDDDFLQSSEDLLFRRLTFQRSQNLVQSEALLEREESLKVAGEKERKSTHSSKSKKRGNRRRNDSHASPIDDSSYGLIFNHDYLASAYHAGIISGFVLISSYLERVASTEQSVKATIIGLGAGMLPMFLHGCLPFIHIEVVELDPVVSKLAKDYFGFREDERLKVHVADGIQFVRGAGKTKAAEMTASCETDDAGCSAGSLGSSAGSLGSSESSLQPIEVGEGSNRMDILIVDVDSSDSSSGMTCPAADFVEESFLLSVKDSISEQGLFIINLVSRSPAIKALVISRMKTVFCNLYSLQIEEDVNEVIFALNTKVNTDIQLHEASQRLEKLLKLNNHATGERIIDGINNIKNLK